LGKTPLSQINLKNECKKIFSALVGKLLKVSRVEERGSPDSDIWNPRSVLGQGGGQYTDIATTQK
jgi:hypothetical protein